VEALIHVDTHVLVWLYAGEAGRFPPEARQLLEDSQIVASPMAVLELQYLHEIKCISEPGARVVQDLAARIGLQIDDVSFRELIASAEHLSFTRDPFDRLIVAHASVRNAALLTADKTVLKHYKRAVWNKTKR
jgi:PIN domain nuclease of toxin-antitoxin system